MGFPRHRPLNKILSYVGIVVLLAGAMILLLQNRNRAPNDSSPPDFLSSTTPAPDPLPTAAYDLLPPVTMVPGTIIDESNQSLDPVQIEENGQQQAQNEYLDLYSLNDYLPVDIAWWQRESKQVYEYVSKRLGSRLGGRVVVTFAPPESVTCPARGRAFREQRVIQILADEETSEEQILGVLAHELGHLFVAQKYKNLNDVALNEGMATWAAGDYWNEWKGSDFNDSVRDFIDEGSYLPLFENYDFEKAYDPDAPDCVTHRDILYTEMASFLDYLVQSYGMELLSALLDVPQSESIDNKRIVYPPNYKDVYGLEFNQLEYEWLRSLLRPS